MEILHLSIIVINSNSALHCACEEKGRLWQPSGTLRNFGTGGMNINWLFVLKPSVVKWLAVVKCHKRHKVVYTPFVIISEKTTPHGCKPSLLDTYFNVR